MVIIPVIWKDCEMITSLMELGKRHPCARRFASQGFELARPVLNLEIEIEIETVNQSLLLNLETADVRNVPRLAF